MNIATQLIIIFAFGLVITGIVLLGILRAQEVDERAARVAAGANREART